jgi:hypothetical protein
MSWLAIIDLMGGFRGDFFDDPKKLQKAVFSWGFCIQAKN